MKAVRTQNGKPLIGRLEKADTLWLRTKGLLGRRALDADQGLWIIPCNSVHTFFMRFAIDLIFLNRELEVVKTIANVPPGRVTWPVWRAMSVIELQAGFLNANPVRVGEKLHVDSAVS